MTKDKIKFFTMRIPNSFHSKIKSYCAIKEISMKDFYISALTKALNENSSENTISSVKRGLEDIQNQEEVNN